MLPGAPVDCSNTIPFGPDRFFCTFTLSTDGLARRLLFFSRRRRRFVLGMRRALMYRLLRPLTLCRSLMMSGRRGWPALRMRWSRMRRGSGSRLRRSRACMLSCYGFGRFGFSSGRMRRGSRLGFCRSRARMLSRYGFGRFGFSSGRMRRGSRLGFYRSRARMLGRCRSRRLRFSLGCTCMMRGSGLGFCASGGRMLGR